jgi:hypothetical protein
MDFCYYFTYPNSPGMDIYFSKVDYGKYGQLMVSNLIIYQILNMHFVSCLGEKTATI